MKIARRPKIIIKSILELDSYVSTSDESDANKVLGQTAI